jgi:hypothetical protein
MKFTFLPSFYLYLAAFILLVSFLLLPSFVALLILILIGSVLFYFRRARVPFQDTFRLKHEIYLSPIHGKVASIRQNVTRFGDPEIVHEIRITMGFWDEKGLYLPTAGEVTYMKASPGLQVARDAEEHLFYGPPDELAHTDFTLTSSRGVQTLMRFIDCPRGKRPTIWLKSGDRGRGAACFGHYPAGGTLLIYLPKNSDILVYKDEAVVPGKTVIASIKDLK